MKANFICLDFEKGAINAFKLHFPAATIIGCWFHYAQCLFRELCAKGLKKQYGEDDELKKVFENCVALALLPPDIVHFVFVDMLIDRSFGLLQKYKAVFRLYA